MAVNTHQQQQQQQEPKIEKSKSKKINTFQNKWYQKIEIRIWINKQFLIGIKKAVNDDTFISVYVPCIGWKGASIECDNKESQSKSLKKSWLNIF